MKRKRKLIIMLSIVALLLNTMARGEEMTPTPEGVITTTEILQPVPEVVVEEEVKEEG